MPFTSPQRSTLQSERIALGPALVGMSRRDAERLIIEHGGSVVPWGDASASLVVLAEDRQFTQTPPLPVEQIIGESELWRRLGLVDRPEGVCGLYSAAMLAELAGVSPQTLRRWTRRGHLESAGRVGRLELFDFTEVRIARTLAGWLESGKSLPAIDLLVDQLQAAAKPDERPLRDWNLLLDGSRVLVQSSRGQTDPLGQLHLEFPADPQSESPEIAAQLLANQIPAAHRTLEELEESAFELEEAGDLPGAIEARRNLLLHGLRDAESQFLLADLLCRVRDYPAARERYFVTLELDGTHLGARIGLGCVLSELGDHELALAAFRGATDQAPDYADAWRHLAMTLDQGGNHTLATDPWRRFIQLAPEGPWRDAALDRLRSSRCET